LLFFPEDAARLVQTSLVIDDDVRGAKFRGGEPVAVMAATRRSTSSAASGRTVYVPSCRCSSRGRCRIAHINADRALLLIAVLREDS